MDNLTIQLKKLGKSKVESIKLGFERIPATLEELIAACIKQSVLKFNEERVSKKVLQFLTPKAIGEKANLGKIGFGEAYNDQQIEIDKAVNVALQAFKDGLYLVIIDETEIKTLDSKIDLTENSILTFIRLTFLTGTFW